ncbi:hypothetical protein ACFQX7_01320 [Luedemannella flava]
MVELGDLDGAAALAEELRSSAAALDRPAAMMTANRGAALVRAARGDLPAATSALAASLAVADELGTPFERARTLLALGTVLRRGSRSARPVTVSTRPGTSSTRSGRVPGRPGRLRS